MGLQNRVDPFGAILFSPARGALMGNRGGRLHRDDRTLAAARWKSRSWIICLCAFKGRRRAVFGAGYSQLFFLDEPTALAAGHRPCFECRRADVAEFLRAAAPGFNAPALDARLDAERRDGHAKRTHALPIDDLPDGAFFADGAQAFAVRGDRLLPWTFFGYGAPRPRPRGAMVDVLTPPTSLQALRAGYRPLWTQSPS